MKRLATESMQATFCFVSNNTSSRSEASTKAATTAATQQRAKRRKVRGGRRRHLSVLLRPSCCRATRTRTRMC